MVALGDPVTIDFNDYFDGAAAFSIMSVAPAQVAGATPGTVVLTPIIKSITESDTTAGVFEFALLDDVDPIMEEIQTTYEPSVVTVRATDEDGLWSEQMFDVRRNRAPIPYDMTEPRDAGTMPDLLEVNLGDVDSTSGMLRSLGAFIDDDAFTVAVADADDSDAAIAGASVDNILENILFNSTAAGQTTFTMEATDTGGLKVTNKVMVNVYAGPKVKEDAPARITLSIEEAVGQVYPVPVSVLFDVLAPNRDPDDAEFVGATAPAAAAYEAKSSNVFVATVVEAVTGGVLQLTINSIGETDITVTVTQDTGPQDAQFEQKATATFKVIVVS